MLSPALVRAQGAMPTVGYLGAETPDVFATRLAAFRSGLASLGFEEDRTVVIDYAWAQGRNDRLASLAAELVARGPRVIATPGSLAASLAAKAATRTIPIVFETGADPVAVGLVANLNRPGGNVTGVTSLNAEVGPKRLQLLREIVPSAKSAALLINPTNPRNAEATTSSMTAAANALGLQLRVLSASREEDFAPAFAAVAAKQADMLTIANDTLFNRPLQMAALAVKYAVPTAHQSPEFARAGGLISYGGSVADSHRQAGIYVGRVLKGEKPGDLPVQQVTKVECLINARSAKVLGLTVPAHLLSGADEVIE
ncbi:MAG TPA: ABC transporter substrate-binding protein [Reyranella sp.]|nr:ABC transporter substrate-binding protein [Reyranella sp.]